jgi:hypothetical protein
VQFARNMAASRFLRPEEFRGKFTHPSAQPREFALSRRSGHTARVETVAQQRRRRMGG